MPALPWLHRWPSASSWVLAERTRTLLATHCARRPLVIRRRDHTIEMSGGSASRRSRATGPAYAPPRPLISRTRPSKRATRDKSWVSTVVFRLAMSKAELAPPRRARRCAGSSRRDRARCRSRRAAPSRRPASDPCAPSDQLEAAASRPVAWLAPSANPSTRDDNPSTRGESPSTRDDRVAIWACKPFGPRSRFSIPTFRPAIALEKSVNAREIGSSFMTTF